MDYEVTMIEMLKDLDANISPERLTRFLRVCAFGIAHTSARTNCIEGQSAILTNLFAAIQSESKDEFMKRHGDDILKHYHPEAPNA